MPCLGALLHNLKQILISVDQLAQVAIMTLCRPFRKHYADETFSARCWRLHHRQPWKVLRWIVDRIFFWDPDHCLTSFVAECNGEHLPPGMRQ